MRSLVILLLVITLGGCSIFMDPRAVRNVDLKTACEFDFNKPVSLERLSFNLPELWSMFSPCEAIYITHNTRRDDFVVTVLGTFGYDNVVGTSGVMSFGIGTDVHRIGQPVKTPEEWLAWKKSSWKKRQDPERNVKRDITHVRHRNLDCWRIASESYERKPGSSANDEQIHFGVGYTCWENGNDRYHPVGFSAGIAYQDGKPLYDINIEQELLKPVLDSLVLKELSEDAYARRLAAYRQREKERCERLVKSAWKQGARNLVEEDRQLLQECGYDPETLKPIEKQGDG